MSQLNEKQLSALRAFLVLVHEASSDLSDSSETGRMSDSKSTVFAVREASGQLELPADMLADISCWRRRRGMVLQVKAERMFTAGQGMRWERSVGLNDLSRR